LYLEAIAGLEKERLKKLSEITERTEYFFSRPTISKDQLVWKKSTEEATKEILGKLADYISKTDIAQDSWENSIKEFITANSFDNGSVLWPMRYALTGLEKSPGPFEVASVLSVGLGKQEIVYRLNAAANLL
jgi:glutamyl/glutaminyl-tRNA synthetase